MLPLAHSEFRHSNQFRLWFRPWNLLVHRLHSSPCPLCRASPLRLALQRTDAVGSSSGHIMGSARNGLTPGQVMRPVRLGVACSYPERNRKASLRRPELARMFRFGPCYASYCGHFMLQVTRTAPLGTAGGDALHGRSGGRGVSSTGDSPVLALPSTTRTRRPAMLVALAPRPQSSPVVR